MPTADDRKAVSIAMVVYGGHKRVLYVPVLNAREAAAISASIFAYVEGLKRLRRAEVAGASKPGQPWWTK